MPPRRRSADRWRRGGTNRAPRGERRAARALLAAPALLAPLAAAAFTVTIAAGNPTTIYLQVGNGTFTGGNFDAGGQPANNTTINNETVTLSAGVVGNGTKQAMTTNSTASNSFYDGFGFCSAGAQLYIGGFYRRNGGSSAAAIVTATVPAALIDGSGDTISFAQISWTTGGNADTGAEPFPAGTFVPGGVQTVGTIARNQWAESCWTFSYLNTVLPPAGTYTGRVTYTLTTP